MKRTSHPTAQPAARGEGRDEEGLAAEAEIGQAERSFKERVWEWVGQTPSSPRTPILSV